MSLGQYIKAEVWDFPVMTERTRLISYLLYGLKNIIKNTGSNFQHPLARCDYTTLILKKYLYASIFFFSVIEKIVIFCRYFCCLRPPARSFYSQLKRAVEPGEKNFHNARSLQENLARSAANQSARTIVA